MTSLNELILALTLEEQQQFISHLHQKNKRKDTKNIDLFKLLASGTSDTTSICQSLYGQKKTGAYHALRKRLYKSLIDFVAHTNMEEENTMEMQIIRYLIAARNFLHTKQFNMAFKILNKAKVLAEEHFLFNLLTEIYHTQIQYAYTQPQIDLKVLIEKSDQNQKMHLAEEQLNNAYAIIRAQVNEALHKGKPVDITHIISQTLSKYNIDTNDSLTFKSLYQLATIVSLIAYATKHYYKIEDFMIDIYNRIDQHQHKEKQLYYHIQVIYQLANMYFRNKKFQLTYQYLERMEHHMLQRNKKFYQSTYSKYANLLALTHNFTGNVNEAIIIVERSLAKKHSDRESYYDLQLSLAMYYFLKTEYKKSLKQINSLHHTDLWYEQRTSKEWVMKKRLIEILLFVELDFDDLFESRVLSFKRKYGQHLKSVRQERILTYINLVEYLYLNPGEASTQEFSKTVEQSFTYLHESTEDIFVMTFYAWLKAKMRQKPLYPTVLEMINI